MEVGLEGVPFGGKSLARGLQLCPLAGAGGYLFKLKGVLLTGPGNTACVLQDLAPSLWRGQRIPDSEDSAKSAVSRTCLNVLLEREVLSQVLEAGDHRPSLAIDETVTEKEGS